MTPSFPYRPFNWYLKEKFNGAKVYKIPVDAGFTCPNRDGTKSYGGCYYCNNKAYSPNSRIELQNNNSTSHPRILPTLQTQIQQSINYYKKYRNAEKFILYFQAYTNTYASVSRLKEIYDYAYKFPEIAGIAIGTRPDCVDNEILKLINSYTDKLDVWIEYGLQTKHNKTLEMVNRAHTYEDFISAIELTRKHPNIKIAVHTIIGLPGESREEIIDTYKSIANFPIYAIKLEHLYIAKETVFEKWYNEGKISVYNNFTDYLKILGEVITYIPSHWYIQRLIGEINPNYVIAPQWGLSKNQIQQKIIEYLKENNIYQGKNILFS